MNNPHRIRVHWAAYYGGPSFFYPSTCWTDRPGRVKGFLFALVYVLTVLTYTDITRTAPARYGSILGRETTFKSIPETVSGELGHNMPEFVRWFEHWAATRGAGRGDIGDAGTHRAGERISRRQWERITRRADERAARVIREHLRAGDAAELGSVPGTGGELESGERRNGLTRPGGDAGGVPGGDAGGPVLGGPGIAADI